MDYTSFIKIFNEKHIVGKGLKGVVKDWCINNCKENETCSECSKHVIKVIDARDVDIDKVVKIFNLTKDTGIFPSLFKCYKYTTRYYIIMEKVGQNITKKDKFNLELLIKNIIFKLSSMHNLNICHKDLNTKNLIVYNNDIVFVDVDDCSFIESNKDIIQDIKTLYTSILSIIHNRKSIIKISKAISKIQQENTMIQKLYKHYIKLSYNPEIYEQIEKELV